MRWLLSAALSISATQATAVPLGFSRIVSDFDFFNFPSAAVVVDNTAYISFGEGVRTVDPQGAVDLIVPASPSPTHNTLFKTTKAVKDRSGSVLFAAGFSAPDASRVWALYDASDASVPIAVWEDAYRVDGVDQDRRGIGSFDSSGENLAQFLPDGTFQFLPSQWFSGGNVTASGFVGGLASIPDTLGVGPAILSPDGTIEILAPSGEFGAAVRERGDGAGLNVSYADGGAAIVRYASGLTLAVDESLGLPADGVRSAGVTESDFVLVVDGDRDGQGLYVGGFFPGISPLGRDRSVDLFQVFPDLLKIDASVSSVAASESRLYFVLRGESGVWLYVTPDPSIVPEPAAILIAIAGYAVLPRRRNPVA